MSIPLKTADDVLAAAIPLVYVSHESDDRARTTLAGGLAVGAAFFDENHKPINLSRDRLAAEFGLTNDVVMTRAMENLCNGWTTFQKLAGVIDESHTLPTPRGLRGHSDDRGCAAAWALGVPRVIVDGDGGPCQWIVAMPHYRMSFTMLVDEHDGVRLRDVTYMRDFIMMQYGDSKARLSRDLFWWNAGNLEVIPFSKDGKVDFATAPAGLVAAMRKGKPTS